MKKIISLFIAIAFVLQISISSIPVSAATTSSATLTTSSETAEAGDVVYLTVSLTSNPGLTYIKLKISYDTAALTLLGVQNGDIISDLTRGTSYVWSTVNTTTAKGTLATLVFFISESATAGSYPITVTCVEASNHESDVTVSSQQGEITVTPRECLHQMEAVSYSEPTCQKTGSQVLKCQKCDYSETITFDAIDCVAEYEADCENDATCQYCGKVLEKAYDHNYRTQVIEPTTETEGYTIYTCMRCGDSYEDDFLPPIQEHTHTYALYETIAPTCTKKGYAIYKCTASECGSTEKRNETSALGHTYTPAIVSPTCQSQGYTLYTCQTCGDNYKDNITDKVAHNYVGGKCTYCGLDNGGSSDVLPVTGITLSETNVTMKIGDSKWIDATVLPANATNQLVNWTSSDETIADIACSGDNNERGLIVAKANGTVTITVTTADGQFEAKCIVVIGEKTIVKYKWYTGALRHKVIYSDGTYEMEDCAPTNCVCGRDYDDPTPIVNTKVVISSHEATAGETVKVTVSLENNPGIASAILNVSFDTNLLTLQSVEYNTAMGGQTVPPQTMTSPVTLYWVNPFADMSEDCVFATLTFKVSENAKADESTKINITYEADNVYNLAEENIALNITAGTVTVIDYVPGDINGDGVVNNKDVTRLMQYFAGWSVKVNTPALDVNNDGSHNNKDVTRLMQYLAGWNVEIN